MSFTTPDLCDEFADHIQIVEPGLKSFGGRSAFYGEIVTIKCFEDNSMVQEQLFTKGAGKVLVIDGGGSLKRALLGDMLAEEAASNGWQGVVVFGCVRDVDIISTIDLGVQALASCPMKTEKKGAGVVNQSVHFHGVEFKSGNFLYADLNGIIVSPKPLI